MVAIINTTLLKQGRRNVPSETVHLPPSFHHMHILSQGPLPPEISKNKKFGNWDELRIFFFMKKGIESRGLREISIIASSLSSILFMTQGVHNY